MRRGIGAVIQGDAMQGAVDASNNGIVEAPAELMLASHGVWRRKLNMCCGYPLLGCGDLAFAATRPCSEGRFEPVARGSRTADWGCLIDRPESAPWLCS